jgi:adenylate cyclase
MARDSNSLLARLSQRAISDQDTEQEKLNKTLLIFASALMAFAAMVWVAIYHAMGIRFSTTVPFTYVVLSAASLALYLWKGNLPLFRFIQTSLFLFVPFIMQWSIGSYVSSSGVILFGLLAPVGVLVFQGARESLPWFVAYIVLTAVSGFFDYYLTEGIESGVTMQTIAVFFALNFAAMSTIVYLLISYFVRQRDRLATELDTQHQALKEEQEKSEGLLLNILPVRIAQRLKEQHGTIAEGFDDVTVMFADIINFTRLAEEMPPGRVVNMLNEVFSHFDQLAEKHGVEKIKTIGDAYMVAGGLGEHHGYERSGGPDYTEGICAMALDMCQYMDTIWQYMDTRSGMKRRRLQIHVGIGTGPVVAGVIGMKRFIYDLWGDTVNVASRVTGEAGASMVLVDTATYKRVRHLYDFDGPRTLNVKGKGELEAYRLLGRKRQELARTQYERA